MSHYFPNPEECVQRTLFPGVSIRTCAAERMMMSLVDFSPRAVVEDHAHEHEQIGMVLQGRALFSIGHEQKTLGPGDMYRVPSQVRHRVVALDEPVRALDIFCPVREDYR
jgi:quercetin dioxygenase-like cupin family protein